MENKIQVHVKDSCQWWVSPHVYALLTTLNAQVLRFAAKAAGTAMASIAPPVQGEAAQPAVPIASAEVIGSVAAPAPIIPEGPVASSPAAAPPSAAEEQRQDQPTDVVRLVICCAILTHRAEGALYAFNSCKSLD